MIGKSIVEKLWIFWQKIKKKKFWIPNCSIQLISVSSGFAFSKLSIRWGFCAVGMYFSPLLSEPPSSYDVFQLSNLKFYDLLIPQFMVSLCPLKPLGEKFWAQVFFFLHRVATMRLHLHSWVDFCFFLSLSKLYFLLFLITANRYNVRRSVLSLISCRNNSV